MPTINKNKMKMKPTPYAHERDTSAKYYNSCLWKHLRNSWIRDHPVCEVCYRNGIIKQADEVHHINPYQRGLTDEDKWTLLLDEDNLISLCKQCHDDVHRGSITIEPGGGA
jgi:5-methylcytosine-specific restriction protein A